VLSRKVKFNSIDAWKYKDCLIYHSEKKRQEDTFMVYYSIADMEEDIEDMSTRTTLVESLFRFGFGMVNSVYVL
jgi:hypothetical protein